MDHGSGGASGSPTTGGTSDRTGSGGDRGYGVATKISAQSYSGDIGTVWYDDVVVATEQVGCDYNP